MGCGYLLASFKEFKVSLTCSAVDDTLINVTIFEL